MLFSKRFFLAAGFALFVFLSLLPARPIALAFLTWNDAQTLSGTLGSNNAPITSPARALVRDARAWREELVPLLVMAPQLASLPFYGGDLAQAAHAAAWTDELLNAVEPSLVLYERLQEKLAQKKSFGAALIALAQENALQLKTARAALEQVRTRRILINERMLSPQAHALLRIADDASAEWDAALRLLQASPVLLGNGAPRRYLILAQNNDELRPTGGFISAVGVLRVERGEITVESFGDSFAVDDLTLIHPQPPAPLQKYMWASQWLLRDSNWYPDFPTSAALAQSMYDSDHHQKTDGVIAIDTRFMPRLVGALDNLTLQGKPLAQTNVVALLKASWEPMPPGDMSAAWFTGARKNFLAGLMSEIMAHVRGGTVRTGALAQALRQGLREKSVQMYFDDADAEQALRDADWAGAVTPDIGDYLFVVDSNVGFNKVNATVTREISYSIRLTEQGGDGTVAITYTNPSRAAPGECDLLKQHKDDTYASMEQSCFWNFVRVLAPRNSRFHSASGVQDAGAVPDPGEPATFGGYAIIPRNSTQRVTFNYYIPMPLIQDNTYTLTLQQQAGTAPAPVTVRVGVPIGYDVVGATHPFTVTENQGLEFHVSSRDMTIKIFLAKR